MKDENSEHHNNVKCKEYVWIPSRDFESYKYATWSITLLRKNRQQSTKYALDKETMAIYRLTDTRFKKQQKIRKVTFDEQCDTKYAGAVVML